MPSCAQVSASNSSSRVPKPPGMAMKPSDRSCMRCLRTCMLSTTTSCVSRACASSRSSIPAGRIVAVEQDAQFDWSGFTFVDHRDIVAPGRNVVAMITEDQPYLAVDRVRHQAEPIWLVAHADRARLAEGLGHLTV